MKRPLTLALLASLGGCMTAPPPPAPPYRALGTEPFWNLLIDEHHLTFIQPDAQPIRQPHHARPAGAGARRHGGDGAERHRLGIGHHDLRDAPLRGRQPIEGRSDRPGHPAFRNIHYGNCNT